MSRGVHVENGLTLASAASDFEAATATISSKRRRLSLVALLVADSKVERPRSCLSYKHNFRSEKRTLMIKV